MQIESLGFNLSINYINFERNRWVNNKLFVMIEYFYRNILALLYYKKIVWKFDIIYTISSVLDQVILPYMLKLKDKKVQRYSVFDNTVPFKWPWNQFIRTLAWIFFKISLILLKKADRIFVISDELKNYLLERWFDENKLILTWNAIELDLICWAKFDEKFEADALYIGRINDAKWVFDMLEVLEIVVKSKPDFKLNIMWDWDSKTLIHFKEKVIEKKLEKNIVFLWYRTGQEKFDIIKSSKIFLFLSHSESFWVALMEAICSWLYAFVYNLDSFNKLYKNWEVFMFGKWDYQSIAQKIIQIIEWGDFVNKKWLIYERKLTWDKIADLEISN